MIIGGPVASARHYVCEAHVPLGEPGNHDDACPCCEVVRLATREARLREALTALIEVVYQDGPCFDHHCMDPQTVPASFPKHTARCRVARAALGGADAMTLSSHDHGNCEL